MVFLIFEDISKYLTNWILQLKIRPIFKKNRFMSVKIRNAKIEDLPRADSYSLKE